MTQDRPKTASRRSYCDYFFVSFFFIDLGSLWGAIWVACWALLGAQIDHVWHRCLDNFFMSFQDRPKSGQEAPKRLQGAPRSGQELPKSPPRAAKSLPREAQERQRAANTDPSKWSEKSANR